MVPLKKNVERVVESGRGDLADHFHFSEMNLSLFSATWISVANSHHFIFLVK